MKNKVKNSKSILLVICALFLPVANAQGAITLASNNTSFGNITLTWSGSSGISAYPIFENGAHVATVGWGQTSHTLVNRPMGTNTYRVEGCISQGCQDLTKDNQAISNTITVEVGNTVTYQVRRHTNSPAMSEALSDTILFDATSILTTFDGTGDTSCLTQIVRGGAVITYTEGDESIDSNAEFGALEAGINLVDEINWCGTLSLNIAGCANIGGERIAVVRVATNVEGVVWGHEVGHNVGLSHRNGTDTLMNSSTDASNRRVNTFECNNFLTE